MSEELLNKILYDLRIKLERFKEELDFKLLLKFYKDSSYEERLNKLLNEEEKNLRLLFDVAKIGEEFQNNLYQDIQSLLIVDTLVGNIALDIKEASEKDIKKFFNKLMGRIHRYLRNYEEIKNKYEDVKELLEQLSSETFIEIKDISNYFETIKILSISDDERKLLIKYLVEKHAKYLVSLTNNAIQSELRRIEENINEVATENQMPITVTDDEVSVSREDVKDSSEETKEDEIPEVLTIQETNVPKQIEKIVPAEKQYLIDFQTKLEDGEFDLNPIQISEILNVVELLINNFKRIDFNNKTYIEYMNTCNKLCAEIQDADLSDRDFAKIIDNLYSQNIFGLFKETNSFKSFLLVYMYNILLMINSTYENNNIEVDKELIELYMDEYIMKLTVLLNRYNAFEKESYSDNKPIINTEELEKDIMIYFDVNGSSPFERNFSNLSIDAKEDVKTLIEKLKGDKGKKIAYRNTDLKPLCLVNKSVVIFFKKYNDGYVLLDVCLASELPNWTRKEFLSISESDYKLFLDQINNNPDYLDKIEKRSNKILSSITVGSK